MAWVAAETSPARIVNEERDYTSIVLPFGLFQVLNDFSIFNPNSSAFDPVRGIEYAASPIHYIVAATRAVPLKPSS